MNCTCGPDLIGNRASDYGSEGSGFCQRHPYGRIPAGAQVLMGVD